MSKITGTTYSFSSDTNPNLNTYRASGMPSIGDNGKNLAVTSTNISIFSNDMKIGFVQNFSPSEQRTITPIQELGTEGVVQMAAGNTNGGTISMQRFAVYNANLWNSLGLTRTGQFVSASDPDFVRNSSGKKDSTYKTYGNPFKTLKDQRVPLEIRVETKEPGNSETIHVETYVDCWLTAYGRTITSQTITVAETCSMSYSDVI